MRYECLSVDEFNALEPWEKKQTKLVEDILYTEPCTYLKLSNAHTLNKHQIMVDFALTLSYGLS